QTPPPRHKACPPWPPELRHSLLSLHPKSSTSESSVPSPDLSLKPSPSQTSRSRRRPSPPHSMPIPKPHCPTPSLKRPAIAPRLATDLKPFPRAQPATSHSGSRHQAAPPTMGPSTQTGSSARTMSCSPHTPRQRSSPYPHPRSISERNTSAV